MNSSKIQKVLIIQTAFIGDVILATPLLEALFTFNNSIKIDFLLRKGNESLLKENPKVNNILIWDKKNEKYKNLLQLISNIRQQKYDVVINLQRYSSSGLFTIFSHAKHTVGFDKNPFSRFFSKRIKHCIGGNNPKHEIERNLELIKHLGIPTENFKCKLYPTNSDFENVKQYKQEEYIIIAPASVWYTKQFPQIKWIEFLKLLPEKIKVYTLGASEDYDLSQQILLNSGRKNYLNLCGRLSFLQSAALMQDSKMCFVNDSAPMHIASSVDAPTTAIFCSTIPEFGFGPLSSKSNIIEIDEKLECRPCGLHGKATCPKIHFNCAIKIDVKKLVQTIVEKE